MGASIYESKQLREGSKRLNDSVSQLPSMIAAAEREAYFRMRNQKSLMCHSHLEPRG